MFLTAGPPRNQIDITHFCLLLLQQHKCHNNKLLQLALAQQFSYDSLNLAINTEV